jgi:hypothetical protein
MKRIRAVEDPLAAGLSHGYSQPLPTSSHRQDSGQQGKLSIRDLRAVGFANEHQLSKPGRAEADCAPDIDSDRCRGDQSCSKASDDPPNLVADVVVTEFLEAKGDDRSGDGESRRIDEDCEVRMSVCLLRGMP